jgi:hypothetical protein
MILRNSCGRSHCTASMVVDKIDGESVDVEFVPRLSWFPRHVLAQTLVAIMHNLTHSVKEERARLSCLPKSTNVSGKETASGGKSTTSQEAIKRMTE